jgi:hypothetical protein
MPNLRHRRLAGLWRRTSGGGWTRNLSISKKLALMLVLPVLGMLVFAGVAVSEKLSVQDQRSFPAELAEFGVAVSSCVHETQKERGATGVFVGSDGEEFQKELADQRAVTDERRAALDAAIADFDAGAYGPDLEERVANAQELLAQVDEHRAAVDGLALEVADGVGFYTQHNLALLDVVGAIGGVSGDANVARESLAYVNFLQAKERAGQERAIGSGAFAADAFADAAAHTRYLKTVHEAET